MTKKLLPAMIGVALAGGMTVALADVTVMGHIDESITKDDIDGGKDDTNFVCTTCSIGFKGSEDLGNGLKAIFKLDWQYDTNNREKNITDRDQWLGMAGNFGKLRIGTISTPYKSYGAKIDPLYRTALQARDHGLQSTFHSGAGEELEGRATNTARYDSPSWNGLQLAAFYTLDSNDEPEDDNPYGAGISYENGGILAFGSYQDNNGGNQNPRGELTAWKLGGKWTLNNFAVMGQYESATEDVSDTDFYHWTVGASYTMGNNLLYAGYGAGNADGDAADDKDVTAWTVAAIHKMSKRTSVYLGYTTADCDSSGSDLGQLGSYSSACGKVETDSTSGGDNTRFSLGMKHKF
jgi:predicted porin